MDRFLHQASFATGNGGYDRHRSFRLVICFDLANDQIAQSGLNSLKVIYYSVPLFRRNLPAWTWPNCGSWVGCKSSAEKTGG
ncbi:hypothetical protein E1578_22945 [Salmonella enterica subsp. enterica]|nr:hypothetical protein [Salmonella enterica subsp. enterica]